MENSLKYVNKILKEKCEETLKVVYSCGSYSVDLYSYDIKIGSISPCMTKRACDGCIKAIAHVLSQIELHENIKNGDVNAIRKQLQA